MSAVSPTSIAWSLEIPEGICALTYDPLNAQEIVKSVADDRAGATAVFIGTTRNSFKGKLVTRLDYQAYSKLAAKTIAEIVRKAHTAYTRSDHNPDASPDSSIIRTAVHHRLGTVPVGDASIVIAVSSAHRKEAFDACEFILEEVKLKAQIWKREFYEGVPDEEAEWKANVAA